MTKNIITYINPAKNKFPPLPWANIPILLDNPVIKNKKGTKNLSIKFIAQIFKLDFL